MTYVGERNSNITLPFFRENTTQHNSNHTNRNVISKSVLLSPTPSPRIVSSGSAPQQNLHDEASYNQTPQFRQHQKLLVPLYLCFHTSTVLPDGTLLFPFTFLRRRCSQVLAHVKGILLILATRFSYPIGVSKQQTTIAKYTVVLKIIRLHRCE